MNKCIKVIVYLMHKSKTFSIITQKITKNQHKMMNYMHKMHINFVKYCFYEIVESDNG